MVRRRRVHGGAGTRGEHDAHEGSPAAAVRTLAVLLQAGATPLSAWRHLADSGDRRAAAVAARADDGIPLPEAIEAEGGEWRDLAAAWEIATTVGAPIADVLRTIAESLNDAASAADEVRVALAEPAATARLLLWMPLTGLLLGVALGFDTIGVIVGTVPGAACVVVGALLIVAARVWTTRLLDRAQPPPGTPGIRAELVAVALAGGASVERALALVDESLRDRGAEPAGDRVHAVLGLSRAAGVPAGELLRAAAAEQRHDARVNGRLRAARLSTRLLIPLGVCTLPAFLSLGVAPLLLSVLASTPLPV